jgi:hypothetical protein
LLESTPEKLEMLSFLILTTLLWSLFFITLYDLKNRAKLDLSLREIFLLGAIAIGVLITASTELLSLFTLLTPLAIKLFWSAVFVVLLGWVMYLYLRRKETIDALFSVLRGQINKLKKLPWQSYLLLTLIVLSLAATLLTIEINPVPTNGDSMRYHLTRILVWEQQASVRHFATHTLHQISLPPFSEYAIMHINFLAGDDHLSRMVQWVALVVSLIAISDLSKKMGANALQQIFAAVLLVTIPMSITQSTSTMNDLVVTAWLLIFLDFSYRFKHQPKNLFIAALTGLALGLAMISKSTAFIFAFPFSIWVAVSIFRSKGLHKRVIAAGIVLAFFALAINAGQFTRNTITFGQPLGDDAGGTVNELFTLRALASNTIRNIQMHMPAEGKGNPEIVNHIAAGIKKITWNLHELTGLDPEDPRTTFDEKYRGFDSPGGLNTAEGRAGAFLHLILIFFSAILCLARSKDKERKQYILVLVATFLLFSFLLKAQTPMNRLMLPYIIMWVPVIALTFSRTDRRGWIILPLVVWLLSLPWLLNGKSRPLLPNQDRAAAVWPSEGIEAYFVRKPNLLPIYQEAADLITSAQCAEVGIYYQSDTDYFFEYPFWMMLREYGFTGTIKHILVQNESSIYEDLDYSPCAIISNTELYIPGYTLAGSLENYLLYSSP